MRVLIIAVTSFHRFHYADFHDTMTEQMLLISRGPNFYPDPKNNLENTGIFFLNLRSKIKNRLHCTDFNELIIVEGNNVAIHNPGHQPTRSTRIKSAGSNLLSPLNKVFSPIQNSRYSHLFENMNFYTEFHKNSTCSLNAYTVKGGRIRSPY